MASAPLLDRSGADATAMAYGAAAPRAPAASARGAGGDGAVPVEAAAMLREKGERAVECLRYYYGCFPLTAASRERAQKLLGALQRIEADLNAFQAAFPRDQPAISQAVLRRVQPLLGLLGEAFSKSDGK